MIKGEHARARSGGAEASQSKFKVATDVLPFAFAAALLFVSAAVYDATIGTLRVKGILLAIFFVIIFLCNGAVWMSCGGISRCGRCLKRSCAIWAVGVVLVAAVPRLLQLEIPLFWDSGLYYYGLSLAAQFNSSLAYLIHYAAIAYHPSEAYTFFLLPGYLLHPDGTEGINLIRVIMYAASALCIFAILRRCFPKSGPLGAFLATAFVTVAPLGLGTFATLNLDWPLAVFLSYVLFAFVYDRPALLVLSSLCLVFSKEPGIILLIGIVTGYLVAYIYAHRRERRGFQYSVSSLAKDSRIVSIACAVVAAVVLYSFFAQFVEGWNSSTASSSLAEGSIEIVAEFGLNGDYIFYRLLSFFVTNFAWFYVTVIGVSALALAVIKLGTRHRSFRSSRIRDCTGSDSAVLITCSLGALLAFSLFSILYITYNNPRYALPAEFLLTLLSVSLVLCLASKLEWCLSKVATVSVIGVLVVACVQAYTNIDPVTKAVGVEIPCGTKDCAVPIPQKENAYYDEKSIISVTYNNGAPDLAVYNAQLLSRGKIMDELLVRSGYDGSQDIIVWNNHYITQFSFSLTGGLVVQDDFGKQKSLNLEWCESEGRRTLPGREGAVPLNVVDSDNFKALSTTERLSDRAILIVDPLTQRAFDGSNVTTFEQVDQATEDVLNELAKYYAVGNPHWVVSPFQYGMCYYKLTKL